MNNILMTNRYLYFIIRRGLNFSIVYSFQMFFHSSNEHSVSFHGIAYRDKYFGEFNLFS